MAEIANNVLHNVGNVLNSVNTSAAVVGRRIRESRAGDLARAVALMNEREADLADFIGRDPRGKALLPYLNQLVDAMAAERDETGEELDRLARNVNHIKDIVITQQAHAGAASLVQLREIPALLDEALHMNASVLAGRKVEVVTDFEPLPPLLVDKAKFLQVLVNLIANAAEAMDETPIPSRRMTLTARGAGPGKEPRLRVTVSDAGPGVNPVHLAQLFTHGFTTKKNGHGFGLHASAIAAREMGGGLSLERAAAGTGAQFTLELPFISCRAASGGSASPPTG